MNVNSIDMNGVRDMLDSMGLQIPSGADKIMSNIEHQQKQVFINVFLVLMCFLVEVYVEISPSQGQFNKVKLFIMPPIAV